MRPSSTHGVTLAVRHARHHPPNRNRAVLPVPATAPGAGRARTAVASRRGGRSRLAGARVGLARLRVRPGVASGEIENGPWRTSVVTGSPSADSTRAPAWRWTSSSPSAPPRRSTTRPPRTARAAPSTPAATTVLEGEALPAALVERHELRLRPLPDPQRRRPLLDEPGNVATLAGWRAGARRCLAMARARQLAAVGASRAAPARSPLTLRLFDPAPAATESPHSIALPRVVREACS